MTTRKKPTTVTAPRLGPVTIEWRDPDSDWEHFTLIGYSAELRMLRLVGRDAPNGNRYKGTVPFWVPVEDVAVMEEE